MRWFGMERTSIKKVVKHAKDNNALRGLMSYVEILKNMSFKTPKTNEQKSNDKAKRKMIKKSQRKNR